MPEKNVADFFNQHLVGIHFEFERDGNTKKFLVTSFVLSVNEQWYLITAGHCIRQVKDALEHEYQLVRCVLIDSLGFAAKYHDPIPFPYVASNPQCLSDGEENVLDYGVIPISPLYAQLLLANGIKALNEDVWKCQPNEVDFYMLLGIPGEFVKFNPESVELAPTLNFVEELSNRPEGFPQNEFPQFYGHISLGEGMTSIAGMSGGPIFAFQNQNGQFRYWLTAIQSSWLPESHYISASPIAILGDYLNYRAQAN